MENNWPTKKLGEVSRVFSGSSAPQGQSYFANGQYPFLRVSDLNGSKNDSLSIIRDLINDSAVSRLKPVFAKRGTIVFPKSGAAINTNSRAILAVDSYIVSHLAAIEPLPDQALSKWIYFNLLDFDMSKLAMNGSYPSLQLSQIKQIEIPIPPLAEQKKIVVKIERAFAKIDEAARLRSAADADASGLLGAALDRVFEVAREKGWKKGKFIDICTLQRGFDLPKRLRIPGKYNLVSSSGVIDSHNKSKVEGPGVTVGRSGSIGRTFYIEKNFWPLNTVLYVKDFHGNDPRFVYYFLSHFGLKKYGTGTGVPTLNRNNLHNESAFIPPLAEQKKIARELDALSEKVRRLRHLQREVGEELKELKKAVLREAFEGKEN